MVPLVAALRDAGRGRRGRTAGRRARTSSTRRRCSSSARARAAAARTSAPPPTRPPAGARSTARRRWSAARCSSRRCRPPSGSRPRAGSPGSTTRAAAPADVAGCAAQLGGPAGTLAPATRARRCSRATPTRSGSPSRCCRGTPSAAGSASWRPGSGSPAARSRRSARDVVLLAQTEVGEVHEAAPGGSSSMPHKRNPVAAISALACARQAPGLVATLLAAMEQEHERAAGAWHAEWAPLRELLRLGRLGRGLAARRASRGSRSTPSACARTSPRGDPAAAVASAAALVDSALDDRELAGLSPRRRARPSARRRPASRRPRARRSAPWSSAPRPGSPRARRAWRACAPCCRPARAPGSAPC